jgi:phosphoribosylformylglycinamidine cyclo-ligase
MSKAYQQSGVDIHAGYESVKRITAHIERTRVKGMMQGLGSFGACFDLGELNMKHPILVSGTDGVGTKLKLAFMANRHDTIGIDVVAMCVNDVLAQGAKPLFFLDYLALGKNKPEVVESIVKGVADGCVQAGCALIGGETAEMPDMYHEDEYDIAGFCVGVVEKSQLLDPSHVSVNDVVIGLTSSGLHSNGFSLARKICFKDHNLDPNLPYESSTLLETLLTPTKIYVKSVYPLIEKKLIQGIAHITGGGFIENAPRCLQANQGMIINEGSWPMPAIFKTLEELSQIDHLELYEVWNMGIGMMLVVKPENVSEVLGHLKECQEEAYVIGKVSDQVGVQLQ